MTQFSNDMVRIVWQRQPQLFILESSTGSAHRIEINFLIVAALEETNCNRLKMVDSSMLQGYITQRTSGISQSSLAMTIYSDLKRYKAQTHSQLVQFNLQNDGPNTRTSSNSKFTIRLAELHLCQKITKYF